MALYQGIEAWGSPTTTSPTDATLTARAEATLHELGGLAFYFIGGPEVAAQATELEGASGPP